MGPIPLALIDLRFALIAWLSSGLPGPGAVMGQVCLKRALPWAVPVGRRMAVCFCRGALTVRERNAGAYRLGAVKGLEESGAEFPQLDGLSGHRGRPAGTGWLRLKSGRPAARSP